jgi:hypothetical protein
MLSPWQSGASKVGPARRAWRPAVVGGKVSGNARSLQGRARALGESFRPHLLGVTRGVEVRGAARRVRPHGAGGHGQEQHSDEANPGSLSSRRGSSWIRWRTDGMYSRADTSTTTTPTAAVMERWVPRESTCCYCRPAPGAAVAPTDAAGQGRRARRRARVPQAARGGQAYSSKMTYSTGKQATDPDSTPFECRRHVGRRNSKGLRLRGA